MQIHVAHSLQTQPGLPSLGNFFWGTSGLQLSPISAVVEGLRALPGSRGSVSGEVRLGPVCGAPLHGSNC